MEQRISEYMDLIAEAHGMFAEIDEAFHDADPEDITRWDMGRAQEIVRRMGKVIKYVRETRGCWA